MAQIRLDSEEWFRLAMKSTWEVLETTDQFNRKTVHKIVLLGGPGGDLESMWKSKSGVVLYGGNRAILEAIALEHNDKLNDNVEVSYAREQVADVMVWDWFSTVIRRLTPRERRIMSLYFGVGLTLEEIGKKLTLTRERVRQIKDKACRRIRAVNSNPKARN